MNLLWSKKQNLNLIIEKVLGNGMLGKRKFELSFKRKEL